MWFHLYKVQKQEKLVHGVRNQCSIYAQRVIHDKGFWGARSAHFKKIC